MNILLKAGADPSAEDNEGLKPLDYAQGGKFGCSQQLIDTVHAYQSEKAALQHRNYDLPIYYNHDTFFDFDTLFLLDDLC